MSVKLLLYCTKAKQKIRVTEHLYMYDDDLYKLPNGKIKFGNSFELSLYDGQYSKDNFLNGKIVAECECEKIDYYGMEYFAKHFVKNNISIYNKKRSESWGCEWFERVISNEYSYELFDDLPLFKDSCLTFDELGSYVCPNDGFGYFYALHLSNVKVFDEPLSLNECENYFCEELKQAPKNMMNVKLGLGNYVLISIQPQHLCKILNGEKTIEVRKKILNSLKEIL